MRISNGPPSAGVGVATYWNNEQAELLRWLALAGGIWSASECRGEPLDALIEAGFVHVQTDDRVALTDAGLARARELRGSHRDLERAP